MRFSTLAAAVVFVTLPFEAGAADFETRKVNKANGSFTMGNRRQRCLSLLRLLTRSATKSQTCTFYSKTLNRR